MKKVFDFLKYVIDTTQLGFYHICSVFAKGFFFYFRLICSILPFQKKNQAVTFFENKQKDPAAFLFLVLLFFVGVCCHHYLYVDKDDLKYVDNTILEDHIGLVLEVPQEQAIHSQELNLYRKYGKFDIHTFSFSELQETNPDTVAWIMVDGTSVNYPVVQTDNNHYYLNHDYLKNPKASGWIFMDYRNSPNLEDANTIFYGHNLLNKTAFGSLSNVFTDEWFQESNHYILIRIGNEMYVYEVFSCYYIDPEVYYLQNQFASNSEYASFLKTISSRSMYDFHVDVTTDDSIITLSTCSDNNSGRKAIHAKRVRQSSKE